MRTWAWILLLLVLAVAAAFAWTWLAADPGFVQLRIRGTTLETSAVIAVAFLLVLWVGLAVLWRLLRWPFRAWSRSVRRRGRERLAGGLTAFAEGEYASAERDLDRAASHEAFRTPALLALARAAHERGASERANQALDAVGERGSRAACALRARFLIENGHADEALALLKRKAAVGELSPRGLRLLVDAALAAGDADAAMDALPALVRSHALTAEAQEALETRVLAAALAAAPDLARLDALWAGASRAERRRPELVAAFARRSAARGGVLAAKDEIETAERRGWDEELVRVYGELGPLELAARTRKAESWLAVAPASPALLVTLGRLYVQQAMWGKAEDLLSRAVAAAPSAAAWEALGDCRRGQGDAAAAAACYANALHSLRGEPVEAPPSRIRQIAGGVAGDDADGFEERSEHGVPRLPGA
jgi:HemY protein